MNSFSYNRRWVAPSKKDPLCPNFTSFNNIKPISPSLYIATTSESIMIKKGEHSGKAVTEPLIQIHEPSLKSSEYIKVFHR